MRRFPADLRLTGMGCMRLSTAGDRDEQAAVAVLHAALDAGVTLLDTADAYARDDTEIGHNERLIARALDSWPGDRASVTVATKGGLTRPGGEWVPDGRARHLADACAASRRALGVERIDLYQLHAPDPRVPLATSVRALATLQDEGLVGAIGLCNVNVGQIEEARRVAEIASVQVELSIWHDENVLNGVAEYCLAHGIRLLAHRPLGGVNRRRQTRSDSALAQLASRHDVSPFEIALAWLADLSPLVEPLPGPTRIETARSIGRVRGIELSDADRALLDERFPAGRALRFRRAASAGLPVQRTEGEVVLIMGLPGAGKSTLAETYVAQGYDRLNRDESGGSLRGLLPALDRALASGHPRIVVDNTYLSRKSRAEVIQTAWQRGLLVRCVWLSTSLEEAQRNAVERIIARYGKLLTPEEMKSLRKKDIAAFGPRVQFRLRRELEPPDPAEGFTRIDVVPFVRVNDPAFNNGAVIVWCDGILMRSRSGRRSPISPDDLEIPAGYGELLRRYHTDGWKLLGLSWQPEIADKTSTSADVDAVFARMQSLLGVTIDIEYCPHGAGAPACWCRKPLPGLAVVFINRHKLDASQCIYVGAGSQDPGFARRCGFAYRDAQEFFGREEPF